MFNRIATVFICSLLSASPICAAVTDQVALNLKSCHPAPNALPQPLPAGWREFGRYIHLCPVFGRNQQIVLYILTPRLDLAGDDHLFAEKLIKNGVGVARMTLILDVNREIVGEFPGSFPFDPPDTFDVIFTDWHEYYPFRVEFCVHANGMHGPEHPAPLYWNARIGKFQDSPP